MARTLKVALGQMACETGNVESNVEKAVEMVKRAAKQGAQIICFPELFATGYNLSILKEDMAMLSRDKYRYVFEEMSNAAKESEIYIIAPFAYPKSDGELFNSAHLFDSAGRNCGIFSKSHYFGIEEEYFSIGDSYPVFETAIGKIGIMICYDAGFPEVARALMREGAEVIFVPSAWRIQDLHAWLLNIPSRALENQLFTVGVNRSGREGDLVLCGNSVVCDPFGRVLAQMTTEQDGVLVCEIDLDKLYEERAGGGYLKDLDLKKYHNSMRVNVQ